MTSEDGAPRSVINGSDYPDAAAGSNDHGVIMYCKGKAQTRLTFHDGHRRGVACSHLEGIGPDDSQYNHVSLDFCRIVPWERPGCEPIGYSYESIAGTAQTIHRIESETAGLGP